MPKAKQQNPPALPLDEPHGKERSSQTNEMHILEAKSPEKANATVLIIGSSMIERMQTTGQAFMPLFKDCVLAGVGGDRIQEMLWRVTHGVVKACAESVQTVVLMAGTNNIEKADPQELAEKGLRTLIQAILDERPTIKRFIVFGLPPRMSPLPKLDDVACMKKVSDYNNFTETGEIPYFKEKYPDIMWEYHYFGEKLKGKDGLKDDKYFDDHVHLNPAGYHVFAQSLAEVLSLGEVPDPKPAESKVTTE